MQKVAEKKTVLAPRLKSISKSLAILILVLTIFYPLFFNRNTCRHKSISVNKIYICSEVADSAYERSVGLAGIDNFNKFQSLLFIFDKEDKHGIWMKNMLIPIDIIWLNSDKQIIHIKKNVSPDTYPMIFYSETNAKYVVETKAGFVDENKLNLLDQFNW